MKSSNAFPCSIQYIRCRHHHYELVLTLADGFGHSFPAATDDVIAAFTGIARSCHTVRLLLQQVRHCDLNDIAFILRLNRAMRRQNKLLKIAGANEAVSKLLIQCGAEQLL